MADILRAEGVVIKRHLFSNTSLIATCYTDGFGKVRLIAKGALRPGSPFRGKLDLFMRNSILFYRGRSDLHTLKECSPIRSYRGVREHIDRIMAASYIAEMIDGLTVAENSDACLYSTLVRCLDTVDGSGSAASDAACFALTILETLGHFPQHGRCIRCGAALEGERYFDGRAFRCAGCSSGSMRISQGTMVIIDSILDGDYPGIPLPASGDHLRELAVLSSRIFACESGRRIKTKLPV